MQTCQIDIAAFGPDHLDAAAAIARQVDWPHRPATRPLPPGDVAGGTDLSDWLAASEACTSAAHCHDKAANSPCRFRPIIFALANQAFG